MKGNIWSYVLNRRAQDPYFEHIEVPDEGLCFKTVVGKLERELILKTLEKTHGNKKAAAELLNLKRTTLLEKLKRFQELSET